MIIWTVGDRVTWKPSNGTDHGTVTHVDQQCVTIRWDGERRLAVFRVDCEDLAAEP